MGIKNVFLLFVLIIGCYCEGPILETKIGKIQGIQSEKTFRNKTFTVNAYLGIPYAKPPVGKLRFKRPVPYGDLASPFDASKFGSSCPQIERPPFAKYSINEDCLFLNVYVPATASDRPEGHAIMIWIHGGGLNYGAGQLYAGEVLAAHGNVIVVTINYRVGVFGFLNIGDERAQGNMGLWDQRQAMIWVKENIGRFGGDINRITVFGESAGAVSVNIHIMYPPNEGLFQQAISQSGAARSKFGSAAPHVALAAYLGCDLSTTDEIFDCLNNTNAKDVVDIQLQLRTDISKYEEISFMETIDGEIIKRFQHDTIQDGLKNRPSDEVEFMQSLRYINGVNSNEGLSTFLRILNAPLNEMIVTKEMMDNVYIQKFLPYVYPGQEVPPEVQKVIAYEYTNWNDPKDATRMFVKYAGDVTYNVESMDLRKLHLKGEGSGLWVYSFEANIDQHLLSTPHWATTANHGDDLAPLFGYQIDYKKAYNITDYQPPAWELDLSERMITYWTNFAKYGNPSGNNSIMWPEYEQDSMRHLVLDRTDSIGTRQYAREVEFWREVAPDMMAANEACIKDKGPGDMVASSTNSVFKYFGLSISILLQSIFACYIF